MNFQPELINSPLNLSFDSGEYGECCMSSSFNHNQSTKYSSYNTKHTEDILDFYWFKQEPYCNPIDSILDNEQECLDCEKIPNKSQETNIFAKTPLNDEISPNTVCISTQISTSYGEEFIEYDEKHDLEEAEIMKERDLPGYMMCNFENYIQEDSDIYPIYTKKIHLENTSKFIEETSNLETIALGCNLMSSTNFTPYYHLIQETEEIRPKVPKKKKNHSRKITEKSIFSAESDENESPQSEKSNQKVWVQNKKKNIPGLIVNRVIKSIECATKINQEIDYQDKYYYIRVILTCYNLGTNEIDSFIQYLKGFDVKMRTWNKIQIEINKNSSKSANCYYEKILLECVDTFLSVNGQKDFDDWITDPKTRLRESKKVLLEAKEQFRNNFKSKLSFSI